MDQLSLARIDTLHPKLRDEARYVFKLADRELTGAAKPRITQAFRTFEQQTALYEQGRSSAGRIVTNAKAGHSFHNYGLALDFCLLLNGGKEASWDMRKDFDGDCTPDWMEVVGIFKAHGWKWGGDWNSFQDYAHFQKTFGLTWQDCEIKHEGGAVDDAGYIRI